MPGIQTPDWSKLVKNLKNENDAKLFRHEVIVKFFWRRFVSLAKCSFPSKFHVNISTGSRIMTNHFYKGLTRNIEIRNTHVWVLPNIWGPRRVMDTKIGTHVSNRMVLNAAKCQGYIFYRFWVIKGKPNRGKGKIPLPSSRLGLEDLFLQKPQGCHIDPPLSPSSSVYIMDSRTRKQIKV